MADHGERRRRELHHQLDCPDLFHPDIRDLVHVKYLHTPMTSASAGTMREYMLPTSQANSFIILTPCITSVVRLTLASVNATPFFRWLNMMPTKKNCNGKPNMQT
jgi:hypothetical protein